ncbi:MAG: hypothetical protein Fur009_2070 [Candidatus Microgenomates bacterium]
MRLKLYFFIAFYTLLFLFYPGDNLYFKIFAYNKDLFSKKEIVLKKQKKLVPFLKNPFFYPDLSAQGVYVVDYESFTPLLQKSSHEKFLPASTVKIITALTALDLYKPDEIITVKKTISDGQLMGLVEGEKISFENLLFGMLVHSGNDAAYVIAQNFGYKKFVDLMNKKAQQYQMKNSFFSDPTGLSETNQYTTPYDLALASRKLLKNHYLAKIVSTKEITVSDIDFKYFHKLTNVNKLLGQISGIGGLKTGYTENAGENLVSFYKKNSHQYLIVVLKSQDRFADTEKIINWLNENVDYITIDF